jgi:hypothetical protein
MKAAPAAAIAMMLVACGGGAGPEARTPAAPSGPTRPLPIAEPQEEAKTMIEVIVVPERWVEKTLAAPPGDVKAWSEVLANRASIQTDARHVLVRVKQGAAEAEDRAARKKAEAALARVKKGEDFAKVAKEMSEDPGSKDRGGLLPGTDVKNFVEPVKAAYAALAPGEVSKEPVRTSFGWHVLRREAPTEEQIVAAYRKARAPELTKKLADEILAKLRAGEATRPAVAAAVESVLGDQAEADPDRPQAMLVDGRRLDAARLPREAKDSLDAFAKKARPGEAVESPIATPKALVVARVAGAR